MKIAVIGGGISGLAAGYEARRRGHQVTVYEGRRWGGAISTQRRDGLVMEGGPDSILSEKPAALDLARELGLESVPTRPEFRGSLIVRGHRLIKIPEGLRLMAPQMVWPFLRSRVVSWPGKLRMALDLVLPRRTDPSDETLASFVRRRLGRECLERLAQPLIAGIYSADPEELSMQATMPMFLELERQYRSILLGMWRRRPGQAQGPRYSLFHSFRTGLFELVEALMAYLGPEVLHQVGVAELGRQDDGRWWVQPEGAERVSYDAVVVATPAPVAARLLNGVDPVLAADLARIRTHSAATVNLVYPRRAIGRSLKAYGFVVPAVESMSLLACTFSHLKYPDRAPEPSALLRAYLGGARDEGVLDLSDTELTHLATRELAELLQITAPPEQVLIERHRGGTPLFALHHLALAESLEARSQSHPGLALSGNYLFGVGIPDCVGRSRQVVGRLSGS